MAAANDASDLGPSAAAKERMDAVHDASERIRNLNRTYAEPRERIFYGEEGRHSTMALGFGRGRFLHP